MEAAATRIGNSDTTAVVAAFEDHGVSFAWQLVHATDSDYAACGASLGLKMAIKNELIESDESAAQDADGQCHGDEVHDRLRHFLLMPSLDGQEAQRLRDSSAIFLAILTVPPSERQGLMLCLLEMCVIISGLLLPLPLSVLRDYSSDHDRGWHISPSSGDGMDALALFAFINMIFMAFLSVMLAMHTTCAGYHGSSQFYESAMSIIGALFVILLVGGLYPLIFLWSWFIFAAAESPYLAIGAEIMASVLAVGFGNTVFLTFMLDQMTLEMYHLPDWMLTLGRMHNPHLAHRFDMKVLENGARKRAAELQVHCRLSE